MCENSTVRVVDCEACGGNGGWDVIGPYHTVWRRCEVCRGTCEQEVGIAALIEGMLAPVVKED